MNTFEKEMNDVIALALDNKEAIEAGFQAAPTEPVEAHIAPRLVDVLRKYADFYGVPVEKVAGGFIAIGLQANLGENRAILDTALILAGEDPQ